jgi:hypothetical protein
MPTKEAAQLINTAAAAAVASFKTSKQIIPPWGRDSKCRAAEMQGSVADAPSPNLLHAVAMPSINFTLKQLK